MVAAFQFCSATLVMCGWYYYAVWARARTRAMPEYPCVPLGECHHNTSVDFLEGLDHPHPRLPNGVYERKPVRASFVSRGAPKYMWFLF
jgi:hypothetical protein